MSTSPGVTIHRCTRADWERFRDLRLASLLDAPGAFGSTYDTVARRPDSDWPEMIEEVTTFVAVLDGEDAGLVRTAPDAFGNDAAWLISMWVAPASRGRGVGDALVDAVVRNATSDGYARLCLDVADDNEPAIRLYARHGFEPTGEVSRMKAPREHITEHRRAKLLR